MHTTGNASGGVVEGFYINNSTYAYRSMKEGDSFAKKFGGEDGTDPDFFFLSIKEHGHRNVSNDSIVFYLADYRSTDPAEDYIIDQWTYIDLQRFENIDTLSFTLYSSDVGMFGMNTPAYFCVDDITTADVSLTSIKINEPAIDVTIYPNPTTSFVFIDGIQDGANYKIYNETGHLVLSDVLDGQRVNVSSLSSGMFLIEFMTSNGPLIKTFLKN